MPKFLILIVRGTINMEAEARSSQDFPKTLQIFIRPLANKIKLIQSLTRGSQLVLRLLKSSI